MTGSGPHGVLNLDAKCRCTAWRGVTHHANGRISGSGKIGCLELGSVGSVVREYARTEQSLFLVAKRKYGVGERGYTDVCVGRMIVSYRSADV